MTDTIKRKTVLIVWVLLLLCITALYFFPVVFSSKTFASRDMYAFFYPRQLFASECVKSGILPLWNPHLASGVPFLANLQSSVFYPLSCIYYLLPFQAGFKYFIILHYFIAGLWMFLLMRHWDYDNHASMVSALAFMFGGYMISILDNVAFLTAAAWLPLIILLYDRFMKERRSRDLILTGCVIALQILGGDASVYVLSTGIFMIAYHAYSLRAAHYKTFASKIRSFSYLLCVWLLGFLLAAVVLIPFAEYVYYSTRMTGFSYEEMTRWSYHPLELFQLLVPYLFGTTVPMSRWFGQFWLDTFYLGILPILLVIFCLWRPKQTMPYFLLCVVLIAMIMAFGKYTPLYALVRYIPGLNVIHYPVKYLYLAAFSLALLAGMGCSILFEKLKTQEAKGFDRFLIIINSTAIIVLFSALLIDDKLFQSFQGIYPQTLFHKIITAESAYLSIFNGYAIFVLFLTVASALMILTMRGKIAVGPAKGMIILLLFADLMVVGKPRDVLIESEIYEKPNQVVQRLQADTAHYRIFSLAYTTFEGFMHIPHVPFDRTLVTLQNFMMPNLSLIFGIDTIDEYAEMLVTRYYALFHPVKEYFRDRDAVPTHVCRSILDLLNVKYLISSYRLSDDAFNQVQGGPVKIYENQTVLPRAFWISNVSVLNDEDAVLKAMQAPDFDPRAAVLLSRKEYHKIGEDAASNRLQKRDTDSTAVKILKYLPNRVEIETTGKEKGFLVLTDNYYPGWKVCVNGRKKNILRVYYNLRGVYLPPGNNKITFTFQPLSFTIGAAISCSAFLGVVIVLLRGRKTKRVAV